MNIDVEHIFLNKKFDNKNEYFNFIADILKKENYVKDDYGLGLSEREESFPTGLPLPIGVAIPHTDASYVNKDTITITTFEIPIEFLEMGGEESDKVDVKLAINLVLSDGNKHLETLQKIIEKIQNEGFVESVISTNVKNEIKRIFEGE